ncbi:hypothetical protein EVAR_35976_1 [Eumeta japonica]|uniref:Uncharacterized protein n=1 Tax=Eumeta variegata TaxID=151549 RepID=A0A4C1WW63_EUMVA|nr:hypothetical protein EVAR_35976_1 [Eumeta japonica]
MNLALVDLLLIKSILFWKKVINNSTGRKRPREALARGERDPAAHGNYGSYNARGRTHSALLLRLGGSSHLKPKYTLTHSGSGTANTRGHRRCDVIRTLTLSRRYQRLRFNQLSESSVEGVAIEKDAMCEFLLNWVQVKHSDIGLRQERDLL